MHTIPVRQYCILKFQSVRPLRRKELQTCLDSFSVNITTSKAVPSVTNGNLMNCKLVTYMPEQNIHKISRALSETLGAY